MLSACARRSSKDNSSAIESARCAASTSGERLGTKATETSDRDEEARRHQKAHRKADVAILAPPTRSRRPVPERNLAWVRFHSAVDGAAHAQEFHESARQRLRCLFRNEMPARQCGRAEIMGPSAPNGLGICELSLLLARD